MNKIISTIKVFLLALILSLGISYALAWTAPLSAPPAGNVSAPINTSATIQSKTGGLNIATLTGNVGIGTAIPVSKLDVVGNITATDFCTSSGKCLSSIYTPGTQTFIPTGMWQYFTVPSGVSSINVEMWGGGGGGGTGELSHNYTGYATYTLGGAGSAGAYVKKTGIPVVAGQQYKFIAGQGGSPGARPTLNNCMAGSTWSGSGGPSLMYSPSWTPLLSAEGGKGNISHTWCITGGSGNGNSLCIPDPSPTVTGGIASGGTTNLTGNGGVGCATWRTTGPLATDIRRGGLSVSLDHNGAPGAGAGGNGRSYDFYGTDGAPGKVIVWW
ncbi:MAG: glycine-rich domain-containing protein [Minisyncoccia bacterium]